MNFHQFCFRPFMLMKEIESKNSLVPGARSGHRICCDDKSLYVFGGYNFEEDAESHNLYKEILSFNFSSKCWDLINDDSVDDQFPDELASSSMLMYGSNLVIFGGTSYPFGMRCSDKVTLVNIESKESPKIQQLVTHNTLAHQPPGQYGMSIKCMDGFLYTVGGTQGFDYTADIFRLDFKKQIWELVARSRPEIDPIQPIGRYRHEIAIDKRYIYIFGGGTSDTVFDLQTLPAYDLIEKKWCRIETKSDVKSGFPPRRKCHSLVQFTSKDLEGKDETFVFISGGLNHEGSIKDIWSLSLKTLQWMRFNKTNLPTSLFFHDACITSDGAMYIFGGITTNTIRSNKLFKMWVTIPKLSVMCWEAILYYYPKVYMKSREELLERGVPKHFVDRVHPPESSTNIKR